MKRKVSTFDITDLLPIGLTFVVLGIGLAYGLNVMGDIENDFGENACLSDANGHTSYNTSSGLCYNSTNLTDTSIPVTADYNATGDSIVGVAKIPEKLPLIATVVVAAVIIGILVRYLFVRFT